MNQTHQLRESSLQRIAVVRSLGGLGDFLCTVPALRSLRAALPQTEIVLIGLPSMGRRLQGPNQVYCLDQLGIAAFVGISDESTKIELAKHLLSPLDQEVDLLETLDVFFLENCCPSTTAKRLSIHRNTLSYRLDKITSLTGLDPRQFDEAMQIRLALLLRSLQGNSTQLYRCPKDLN